MRKAFYFLGQLRDEDVAWIGAAGRQRALEPGEELIKQGVAISDLFILLHGQLAVRAGTREIVTLGPGEIVGEMSLIESRPPAVMVASSAPSLVLAVERTLLETKLSEDAEFAARFYRAVAMFLSARMRAMTARLEPDGVSEDADEIDEISLDSVHLAGIRFDDILRRLVKAEGP